MQIHHIGILTNDLEGLTNFYVKYFGGKPRDLYCDPSEPVSIYFVDFPDGAKLEIMQKPNCKDYSKETLKTGLVHLAFSVGNREEVDAFSAKLKDSGVTLVMEPTLLGDGSYESCFADPDGNLIEIVI